MWTVEFAITAQVDRDVLWRTWTDVEGWATWDPRCQWVRLNGPFKSGQTGRAKFRGAPPSDYEITTVDPGRVFWLESGSPLVRTVYEHHLADVAAGATELRQRVSVKGFLAPLLALSIRRRMHVSGPDKLRLLADASTQRQSGEAIGLE